MCENLRGSGTTSNVCILILKSGNQEGDKENRDRKFPLENMWLKTLHHLWKKTRSKEAEVR